MTRNRLVTGFVFAAALAFVATLASIVPVGFANTCIRGDCNESGAIDAGDPICTVLCLIGSPVASSCACEADCNCTGGVEASDPVCSVLRLIGGFEPDSCTTTTTTTTTTTSTTTTTMMPLDCPGAGGVEVGGFCWFAGAADESCDTTCGDAGLLYDHATRTYAGSHGSNANCDAVLGALRDAGAGVPDDVDGSVDLFDTQNVGCVFLTPDVTDPITQQPFCPQTDPADGTCWLRITSFTVSSSAVSFAQRACACRAVPTTTTLPCTPDCAGKQCGDDGCGDPCGICDFAYPFCVDGTCEPECGDPFFDPLCEGACADEGNTCADGLLGCECIEPSECRDLGGGVCSGDCAVSGGSCGCAGSGVCTFGAVCDPVNQTGCPPGYNCVDGVITACLGPSCNFDSECAAAGGGACFCLLSGCTCQ